MAAFEVLALDTATPQIRAPGASDTYTFPRAVELPLGTANGVLYLNGSKVVSSGSNLTFDGAVLAAGGAAGNGRVYVTNSVGGYSLALMGATKAIRVEHTATQSNISGVDSTLVGSYEPIMLNGSIVLFGINGSEQMRLNSTGLGIGASSPGAKLHINTGGNAATGGILLQNGSNQQHFWYLSSNTVSAFEIGSSNGQWTWTNSNGEQMRLNASGNLGLGVTPSAWFSGYRAIEIGTALGAYNFATNSGLAFNTVDDGAWKYRTSNFAGRYLYQTNSGYYSWLNAASGTAGNAITWIEQMRLDNSGNLGLGVTPSAWSYKAIELLGGAASGISATDFRLYQNAYEAASSIYKTSAAATMYRQTGASHIWYNAPSGTAGNAITFTQAMTLDASGRLLLGTTSATGAVMDIQGSAAGAVQLLNIQNTSTNAAAISRLSIGSQGGNWNIDNERTAAPLKFSFGSSLYLMLDSSGNVVTGNAAIATNATNGFLYVPTCAGTPTGTPTTYTGRSPIVVDTTNNKLYFYSGGAWRDAGP